MEIDDTHVFRFDSGFFDAIVVSVVECAVVLDFRDDSRVVFTFASVASLQLGSESCPEF